MKILHVINLGYLAGGAEASVLMLRDEQRKAGHDARVLSTNIEGGVLFSDYQVQAIRKTGVLRIFHYIFYPNAYHTMRKILREFSPDIVHFHTIGLFSPSILFAARSTPSVLTVHGPEPFTLKLLPWTLMPQDYIEGPEGVRRLTFVGNFHYAYFRYVLYPCYHWCLRWVCYLIAPSVYMAGTLETDVPKGKIVHIYNGIDLPLQASLTRYDRLLYVGRLEKAKGVEYLIAATARIREVFPRIQLHIVGDGSYRRALEAQVVALGLSESIRFTGWLADREKIIKEYEDSTVLVVPSVWPENLGSVCIEAMAVGRVVIGTDNGGLRELIKEGETGYIVPIKNADAIVNRLTYLLQHPELLEKMSQSAAALAHNFSIDIFAKKIEDVYKRALNIRKP